VDKPQTDKPQIGQIPRIRKHPNGQTAIKLQPEGREKFFWSGEQFVITCHNNNHLKNGE